MRWYLGFSIAMLVLAAATAAAIASSRSTRVRRRTLKPFHYVFGGVFLSVFILMLPIYSELLAGTSSRWLKTVAFSLHNTFQAFTIDTDREIILEGVRCPAAWLDALYSACLSVAFVVAPVLTFGFVLSLFRNVSAYARYFLHFFRDVYVFSEINDKSLALGEDLRRNHKRALIVYTDVFETGDESMYERIGRAHALHAILFRKDVSDVNFKAHYKAAQIVFFAIGENETENVDHALKLIDLYRQRERTRLFVFASRIDGELLLNRADTGVLRVRRVNEIRSLINRLLYEQGEQLFANAKPMPDGQKKISAVIVGLGRYGTEMLKALTWYGQMDGYRVELDAFDADEKAEDRFCALAPELMSPQHNGADIPGEAAYTIRIHADVEIGTKTFSDAIGKLTDATYVFVSLGSDEQNIRAAVELRMLFLRMGIHPVIRSIIYRSEERAALDGITNFRGQPYEIGFIGDTKTSCSEAVVMNSELEASALRRHLKWGDEDAFWQYEYNYNSSVASAIHLRARIACGIPGAKKREEDLTDEERTSIERLEHRRWNAYLRAEGYVYSGSPDKSSRNDLAKTHHDLVPYSLLNEEEKRKNSRVGTD